MLIRPRINSFLDAMNISFFQPRGLFCLIMAYEPNHSSPTEIINMSETITKTVALSTSKTNSIMKALKSSSGTTYNELEMPEAAPLVFPSLDNASNAGNQGIFQRSSAFMTDYLDRRAQASYVSKP